MCLPAGRMRKLLEMEAVGPEAERFPEGFERIAAGWKYHDTARSV